MPAHPEWATIALLGALHGVNPAMGWLFAVSLGLQAQRAAAVWSALGQLALGHAMAVVAALATAALLGAVVPLHWVRWIAAGALLAFGLLHLRSHRHPRLAGVGMRVGPRQLALWSFVVSSAHGAGLMVLPFVLRRTVAGGAEGVGGDVHAAHGGGHGAHMAGMAATGGDAAALLATLLHTAAYLAVAGAIAWFVYARLGLRFLRKAWINMDVIWAAALILAALATAAQGQEGTAGKRWAFANARYDVESSASVFAGYGHGPVFGMLGMSHSARSGDAELTAGAGAVVSMGAFGEHWLAVATARRAERSSANVYWLPAVRTGRVKARATVKMSVPYDGGAQALAIAPLSFTMPLARRVSLGPAVDVVMKEGARPSVALGAQLRVRLPGIGAGVDVQREPAGDGTRLRAWMSGFSSL